MKTIKFFALLGMLFLFPFAACSKEDPPVTQTTEQKSDTLRTDENNPGTNNTHPPMQTNKIKLTVGTRVFTATLADTETSKAFAAMLPLTLEMRDFNNNEKVMDLGRTLPRKDSSVTRIETGDIMLYSGNSLVLFYESFTSGYSYSRIGKIDDASGLKSALGSGTVTILWEAQ